MQISELIKQEKINLNYLNKKLNNINTNRITNKIVKIKFSLSFYR